MKKLVSVTTWKREKILSTSSARLQSRIPDQAVFFGGAVVTLALPRIIYSWSGGPIPISVFVALLLLGTTIGIGKYVRGPKPILSCVSHEAGNPAAQEIEPVDELNNLKAA